MQRYRKMNKAAETSTRETGQVLSTHYWFILWLIPTLMRFSYAQKFLLGGRIQNTAIASFPALLEASNRAAKRKHNRCDVAAFLVNQECEVLHLEREL